MAYDEVTVVRTPDIRWAPSNTGAYGFHIEGDEVMLRSIAACAGEPH